MLTKASSDGDPDAVLRELYSHHAKALHGYVEKFCPDRASADDIVQETFIRAWRHLPRLSADDRPVRPWLFRVARNLLDRREPGRTSPADDRAGAGGRGGRDRFWIGGDPRSAARFRRAPAPVARAPGRAAWRPSTGAGPWRRSPASSAYRMAQPDHDCTTRSMHCASNSKNTTRSRADRTTVCPRTSRPPTPMASRRCLPPGHRSAGG